MNTIPEVQQQLNDAQYFANEETAQAVRAALVLEKPLLIEGPPGVGKTAVAHAMASLFNEKLLRVQCYEGIDADQLLYDYNYAKQLLMISMIKDRIHKKIESKSIRKSIETLDKEDVFWGEHFLIKRPVLQAIVPDNGKRQVLLIDEVDKTEKDAEALLLEVLSEYTISIPEYGTIKASIKPVIILTGNRTRQLTEALRRRCVYLYLDYPDIETEKAIVSIHEPDADENYLKRVVDAVQKIRKLPLKQIPSVSETIEVVRLLIAANGETDGWLNLVAKHNEDFHTIKKSKINV
ncbi:MAG: MoxR family ATPase [Thermodesulfobacteriota bacterium]|nr:MoxR family ATPase [Thermodesulfobacteriota bacterium]